MKNFIVRRQVARGAKLLDRKLPGWHTRVNPSTLDIQDAYRCIGAQAYGGTFDQFVRAVRTRLGAMSLSMIWAFRRGFWRNVHRDAWLDLIEARCQADQMELLYLAPPIKTEDRDPPLRTRV